MGRSAADGKADDPTLQHGEPTMLPEFTRARVLFDAGELQQAEELYRRGLTIEPYDPEANYLFGLSLLRIGKAQEAIGHLEQVVKLDADNALLRNHLGIALGEAGRLEESLASFRAAAKLDPRMADALYNQGNVLRRMRRLDEAVVQYRAALDLTPASANTHYNLANTLLEMGRLKEAAAGYQEAIKAAPDHLNAYNNLGNVFREQGKLSEAAEVFSAALKVNADYVEARHNLALVLLAQDNKEPAITHLREALRVRPDFLEARNSLGKALMEQGNLDEAIRVLQSAQAAGQATVNSQLRLAEGLRMAGRFEEAIECLQGLLAANAALAEAHNNLGLVWFGKNELDNAIACYRRAIELKPDLADGHNNLAIALDAYGDLDGAIEHVQHALFHNPAMGMARLNRAVMWLRRGDFERGWQEYEWRRMTEKHRPADFPVPRWDGKMMEGKTILVHAEQGLGDTFQFVRYLPLVRRCCERLVLECQPPLQAILQRCPGIDQVVPRGESLPEFHAHIPLASLPLVLGTTMDGLVTESPYVFADPVLEEGWRTRLASCGGLRIGIAWQGNPNYGGDKNRSIALKHFAPLMQLSGITLLGLQKGKGAEQLEELGGQWPVVNLSAELDIANGAFMDSAAILRNIDLLITSDSAIAHLAGALGVPVWVALSRSSDWRWFDDREDSPWYPTMRLFRQLHLGDWDDVFLRIAAAVQNVLDGDRTALLPVRPSQGLSITAPLGAGDLFDRIAILTIKCRRLTRLEGRPELARQLDELLAIRDGRIPDRPEIASLATELGMVNEKLWDIEEQIRLCERQQAFGPHFVELARSVYRTNDRRAAIKRQIDELLGSAYSDAKDYNSAARPENPSDL